MAILLTGGAGYIGSHAAVEMLNSGYEIIILDNFSNSHLESIERIKEITNKEFAFYNQDLMDYHALNEVFKKEKIEAVIHFAGLKSVGESAAMPLTYYRNNIVSLLTLCEIMGNHGVKNLIFSSSATVYGKPKKIPIKESSSLSATNPYGKTKLMIEEILQDLYASDKKWRIAILRYFNPIGAHESGRIGENPRGIPNNIMPFITQVAIGKREKLQIFGGDYETYDGTGIRDYIHVSDLVRGHLKALQYIEKNEGIDVFNLGTGRGHSVLDLVKNFREASSREIPYEITHRRTGDIAVCFADIEKAKKILEWQSEKSLIEMCRDSWNWQMQNPNGYEKIYDKLLKS